MTLEDQIEQLNNVSGLPGVLTFAAEHGMLCARVTLPSCTATVFLHGAHLVSWVPAGQADVFFLSERSDFAEGKAIRGGIPVCFPWFGPDAEHRAGGQPGPAHGFARTQPWVCSMAALMPGKGADADDQLHLTFTLAPSAVSRSYGFQDFRVAYEMVFGREQGRQLSLKFSVANAGTQPLKYEAALHSYFAVGDVRELQLTGLGGAEYIDKTDGFQHKQLADGSFTPTQQTDRVFPANDRPVTITDPKLKRTLEITKQGSATTVVWNPWSDGAASMKDLDPEAWPGFLCVEAANTGTDAIMLAPGEARSMDVTITLAEVPA